MTDDMMNPRSLLEKTPDANMLLKMNGIAAARLVELEVGVLTSATHGEQSPLQLAQRNGYRERYWETPEAASAQWRTVADQIRPKVLKIATIMDKAEPEVLAYMTLRKSTAPNCRA